MGVPLQVQYLDVCQAYISCGFVRLQQVLTGQELFDRRPASVPGFVRVPMDQWWVKSDADLEWNKGCMFNVFVFADMLLEDVWTGWNLKRSDETVKEVELLRLLNN